MNQTQTQAPPMLREYRTPRGCRAELYYWHDLPEFEIDQALMFGWLRMPGQGPTQMFERPDRFEFAIYTEGDMLRVYADNAEQFAAERAALTEGAS